VTRVRELVEARVSEGRELPIESKKAALAVLRNKQRADVLTTDLVRAETSLAVVLGLNPDDRVRAAQEERSMLALPASEDATIEEALANSRELRRLESNMQSKTLEIKGYKAMRLPKVNLVAQYSLLGKYNNYLDYFQRFQRHNAELGGSIEIPLLTGRASEAYVSQAESDLGKLRIEVSRTRSRITANLRRQYQELKQAESARDLARMDLDVAREQVTLDLAQSDEGRVPLAKVEESRAIEQQKWMAYYESQHAAESARLNLLRETGTLVAALK
jgi:outer membrane protein TolC